MALAETTERITSSWEHLAQENLLIGILDTLLRGCGQVMFQNNPLTGLLILVGIFVNSALLGLAGVIGLIISTLTALILGADRTIIRAGLFGYNGILTGIGLAFFVQWNATLIVYVIIASVLSAIVMMALSTLMVSRDMPALTAPFVLTTWLFLFAVFQFSHLKIRPLPATLPGAGFTFLNFLEAFFRGIGEVFFQDNLITGIIFLIAILVNSRISALFAALGSLVGLFVALFLFGGNGYWVYHGLYGFNAVLCGIAVGGVFYVLTWESAIYALVCTLVSTIAMAGISVLLSPIGMPALTAPFVLTSWLFILPKEGFHVLHPVSLLEVTNPEDIRRNFLARHRPSGGIVQPAT